MPAAFKVAAQVSYIWLTSIWLKELGIARVDSLRSFSPWRHSSRWGAHLQFRLPGTYVIALESDNRGRSALPAARFNRYAEEEGLAPALEQRKHAHEMKADASESYRRVAKAIVQVGAAERTSADSNVTRPIGLTLEIVPERNPYAEPRASRLPVRVFFEGRPLAAALVKLTHLEHDEAPLETHRTDPSGRTEFAMPESGTWLLTVVWTKPWRASADVDYDTTFSSLSFGFPRAGVLVSNSESSR